MPAPHSHSSPASRRTVALGCAFALGSTLMALGAGFATASTPRPQDTMTPAQLCATRHAGEKCALGTGMRHSECVGCVSHAHWPPVTGVRWQVIEESLAAHGFVGGPGTDELLGRHGSDTISGGAGADILWADSQPNNNNTFQRDVLRGGPGADWLYTSHGYTRISGGPGNDRITAYYGHGTIDCGPGRDRVLVRRGHHFRLRHCEIVTHPGD